MFKIIAFDLDGTITDTIPMCIKAFQNSVSPYTDHELSREEILHTFGLNEIGMVKAVVAQNWESAIEDFYCLYESMHNEVTNVFPGILKLIAFLKKKNITVALIYTLYLTNSILEQKPATMSNVYVPFSQISVPARYSVVNFFLNFCLCHFSLNHF